MKKSNLITLLLTTITSLFLISGFVFAQEYADYTKINNTTTEEAAAVGSVYHALKKYDSQKTEEVT